VRAARAGAVALGLWLCFSVPASLAAGPPQAGPVWTAGVGTTQAGLRAEINPEGLITNYRFGYIAQTAYESNLAASKDGFTGGFEIPVGGGTSIAAGNAFVTVAQTVTGLSPGTAYRYRLVAANAAGGFTGVAHPFRTLPFAGSSFMLDGRGWELVSASGQSGAEVQAPEKSFNGGTIQAAAGGSAITYSSTSAFGEAAGAPPGSQYIGARGDGGWSTANLTQETVSGSYGPEPDGVPYQLFSGDLARSLMADGNRCDPADPCPRSYSLHDGEGGLLSTSVAQPDLHFAGADEDLEQIVLSTCAALTADASEVSGPEGCDPGEPNLYRWSSAGLSLVNLEPASTVGTPGAALAAQARAVSTDGSRVYWTLGGNLYLRDGSVTKQVDAEVGGGGRFETASATGEVAFFTKAGHLYRYDATAGSAADLTPGGGVQGVLGAGADGGYVYYLTTDGLFVRHGAVTDQIAEGAEAALPSSYPPTTGSARVDAAGTHLAFVSSRSLTGYDNRGADGIPRSEVFLYDANAQDLTCVSCNPTGERPLGGSTMPGAYANGGAPAATRAYKPRTLAENGRRVFFESNDNLALRDRDTSTQQVDGDVYEWEASGAGSCAQPEGCVALVSSGRETAGATFLDASASGDDVFFLTADSLVAADGGFADIYDARVGGGFAEPPKPIECVGDACQFLPSEPEDPTPGTLVPSTGNPPPAATKPKACRKGFVRKRGRCVKRKKKRSGRRGASKHGGSRR
jgi:hypothetical protein